MVIGVVSVTSLKRGCNICILPPCSVVLYTILLLVLVVVVVALVYDVCEEGESSMTSNILKGS